MAVNGTENQVGESSNNGMAVFGFFLLSELSLLVATFAIPEIGCLTVGGMLLDAVICFALGNGSFPSHRGSFQGED